MASARKCDRCGFLYEEYGVANDCNNVNGIMTLNIDRHGRSYSHDAKDLCPKCMKSFEEWLGGANHGYCKAEISN